jgi:hypothetical protein
LRARVAIQGDAYGASREERLMAEPSSQTRWLHRICIAGVVLGAVLVIGGLGWSMVATPAAVWSMEQAAELKAASDAVHAARSGIPEGGDSRAADVGKTDPRYLAAAQARVERINAELEQARDVRDTWGQRVAAAGLAVTIACGLGYLASRGH